MKGTSSLFLLSIVAVFFTAPGNASAIGNDNPSGVTGSYNGEITTAGSYDAYTGNAKRVIDDLVVTGAVGAYPLKWTRVLNTRNTSGGGLGPGGWDYSYNWRGWFYFKPDEDPTCYGFCEKYEGPEAHMDYPDGRRVDFYGDSAPASGVSLGSDPGDRLVRDSTDNGWNLKFQDGGMVHFAPTASTGMVSLIPQKLIDPYGQITTLQRDGLGRLWRIVEPGGRYLQLNYQQYSVNGSNLSLIQSVQAFRSTGNLTETVSYTYTPIADHYVGYYLTRVDYDDPSHAAFAAYSYQPATAGSNSGAFHLIWTCDDVRYAGPMSHIEYEFEEANASWAVATGQVKAEKNVNHEVVSQVQYPVFPPGQTPPVGSTALATRVETRGDGRSRTFMYGKGSNDPEDTGIGILNTYTDFKNLQSELTKVFYHISPQNVPGAVRTTVKAPLNRTTYIDRDLSTNVVKMVTHPTGEYAFSTYDNDAGPYEGPVYLASHRDENGKMTYYARDPVTHAVSKIGYGCDPNGAPGTCPTEEFSYNNLGQVRTHKLTTGGTETFEYDNNPAGPATRGLKTKYIDPLGNPTTYEYYTSGPNTDRLRMVVDPRNNATFYEYNWRGQVTKVQHQDGTYSQSFYRADGMLAWTADENHPNAWADGHDLERTRYEYDEYKRVTKVWKPGETLPTVNGYGLNPSTWGGELLHTTNNVKFTTTPLGRNVVYDYDENLRKVIQNVALQTDDYAPTVFEYDPFGNVTKTTDPRGKVTTFGYDGRDRQIWMDNAVTTDRNGNGHTIEWVYDGVGNKLRETRADNAFRTWEYNDPMNRLTKIVDWRMSTSEPEVATIYGRDVTSTTETITDAKQAVYTFYYDLLHRKASAWYPPDAGGTTRYEYFQYDAAGNLERHDNPAVNVQIFVYDNRNRRTDSYWWFHVGPQIHTDYDDASRVTGITTKRADVFETSLAFGYDDANRQIWEEQTVAGYPTRRVETARDNDGNKNQVRVKTGQQLDYGVDFDYSQRNQLQHIRDSWGGPICDFYYDPAGNLTQRQLRVYYDNPSNFEYDALNRVSMEEQGANGWIFARRHYQYDKPGREVAVWRDEQGSKGEWFRYDVSNHLVNVRYNADQVWTDNPVDWNRWVDYGYTPDKLNRWYVNDNADFKWAGVSPLNQTTQFGQDALGYDANFNLNAMPGFTGSYDAQNQLLSANNGSAQIVYDGLGRCVKRTINGTTTVFAYDGWKPVVEYDGNGSFRACNVYGGGADELVYRWDNVYGALMFKQDKHGNMVALLDSAGNVLEMYSYDAFGKPRVVSVTWDTQNQRWIEYDERTWSNYGNRFMFQGREWIKELGIYDYRHRMYQPGLGRFLQTDPKGFDAGDMNLFRYCGDDPVDRSDPLGLQGEEFGLDQLELARATVRHQVEAAVSDPHRQSAKGWITRKGETHPTLVTYYPSKMVPLYRSGNKYIVGPTVDGQVVTQGGESYELEKAPKSPPGYRTVYNGHSHNDKLQGTSTNGIAAPRWSKYDESISDVDRMDESSGRWHYRRHGREVSAKEAARAGTAKERSQDGPTGSEVNPDAGAPSAKDVDPRQQSTDVPSLAAESTNFAPGKP